MTALSTTALPPVRARLDLSLPIFVGLAVCLVLLVGLPVGWLLVYALTDPKGAPTLANFAQLLTDPTMVDPFVTTMIIATTVGIGVCIVAAPLGWVVARTDMPGRRLVRLLVTASFVTPPFLGAIAWEILAAPNSGILNQWWRWAIGADPFSDPLFDIYSLAGVIFVIGCYTFPYVFVLVANALDRIPGDLEDASAILGARTPHTMRRITIPLVLPAILAGALVAFLQAMTLFGTPAILAMPAGFHTLTTKLWTLFQYPPKPHLAAAAAIPLLVITITLLRAQAAILGRRGFSVVGGKNSDPRLVRLGRMRWPLFALVMLVLCAPVFLPYLALVKAAFVRTVSDPLTFETATLHNFNFVLFEFSQTRLALRNTFLLCVMAATLGTILALVIGYLTARKAVRFWPALHFLATAPIAIPGIVIGVGLFLAWTAPPLVLYGTIWILLMAYFTIELPAAYTQLQASFRAIHPELEEASRILGATRLQALAHVTAPLLRSGVIAAWCFIFIGTMRELSAAILLFTANTKVLSVVIYDLNESGDLGAISVLGIMMLLITFAVVAIAHRLPGAGVGRG